MNLTDIELPIKKEMNDLKKLKSSLSSNNSIIDTVVNYILREKENK